MNSENIGGFSLTTAPQHYYDLALRSAAVNHEQLPWNSATGAICYLRESEEDLLVARGAVHAAEVDAKYIHHANFEHQAEILTASHGERKDALDVLHQSQQAVRSARSRLDEVIGLRALAAQEQVVFVGRLGYTALQVAGVGLNNI
jgi:hypothetical protein